MHIVLNEKHCQVDDQLSLFELRDRNKPTADIIICNGTPVSDDRPLQPFDQVILIQRGEQPSAEELEALLVARHPPEVHDPLKKATIGIAGAGGLGSSIAIALARTGIGQLIIADFDVVEPSNLNRQQYYIDQIGMAKVEALRANLQRINPFTIIRTENRYLNADNIPDLFAGVDIMVEAFDCPEAKAMLSQVWLQQFPDTPLVAASGMAGYGSSNSISTRRAMGNLYICGDGTSAVQPGNGLMAPRVGIAAHHQANTVIRLLLGIDPIEEPIKEK
ncbi:MAG: sulfur carrier protein ThiS adenylyltransferase ThiF [Desulfuromonas sp.]|nr:sulfur carrier protein ThiS adenylyltransferase ThiF [Desulfuromonas sp.]